MDDSMNSGIPATMLVGPTGYAGNGGGFGNGFGGDGWWILLLILLCGGGWGMGGFGGGAMPFMMGMDGGFGLYPWMTTNQTVNGGFRDQMIHDAITSVSDKVVSGFGDVATQLCGGFAGVNAGIANAAAQAEISANARQIADLQQMFGIQTQLAQCCCDNRAATADLKYTIATEACNDRAAVSQGIQTILDKLCALELDGYKRENDNLRSQLNMASLRESQTAQNAFISQGFANEVDALYNRLSNCPVPSTPVYGRTPIFTCGGNSGCGCNSGFVN